MHILSPPPALKTTPKLYEVVDHLIKRGWRPIGSGQTGTYVLGRPGRRGILKLGTFGVMNNFIAFLRANGPNVALPALFGATSPDHLWIGFYCERLQPMTHTQVAAWEEWIVGDWQANRGVAVTDPFGVAEMLGRLHKTAIATPGLGLDVCNPDNVMVRPGTCQLVFSDPFV